MSFRDRSVAIVIRNGKIFSGPVTTVEIDSKHLPSDEVMVEVCKRTKEFLLWN